MLTIFLEFLSILCTVYLIGICILRLGTTYLYVLVPGESEQKEYSQELMSSVELTGNTAMKTVHAIDRICRSYSLNCRLTPSVQIIVNNVASYHYTESSNHCNSCNKSCNLIGQSGSSNQLRSTAVNLDT